jgi:hypothetical protein
MSDELLYHYCSVDTFVKIIEDKTIWLSSLLLSNDSTEGRLVGRLLADCIQRQKKNAMKADHLDEIFEAICAYKGGYGFCLSEGEDLLSQWCRYADDGCGFAIGFSREFLGSLSHQHIDLKQVEYDPDQHKKVVAGVFKKLTATNSIEYEGKKIEPESCLDLLDSENRKRQGAAGFMALLAKGTAHKLFLNADVFRLKHGGFKEEREWRLLKVEDNVVPDGFFGADERIKAYLECEIPARENPIITVMAGPKNATPHYVVRQLLEKNGYEATVLKSDIPYQ